jgi:16S rRNA processing protein RimM
MNRAHKPETLEIGRISKAHGILGEVRVDLHWNDSDSLENAERVWIGVAEGARELGVERARRVPKAYLLKLAGVDDRNAAEALRGLPIAVAREVLPPLADGEYYLADLVGAAVLGPDGPLGRVTSVVTHPTVDALVVELADGRSVELPLVTGFVQHVDAWAKRVEFSSLDGLL